MLELLRFFSLRYAARHPVRVALSAMAVGLGVALYVSSDVSNYSTETAFQSSNRRLQGEAELQVTRGRMLGVEQSVLEKIDATPGVVAAPVLQLTTTLPDFPNEGNLLLLGLDFAREASFRLWRAGETERPEVDPFSLLAANTVFLAGDFAARNDLKPGSTFRIDTPRGVATVRVGAVLEDEGAARVFGGNVGVMALAAAQRMFDRRDTLDRVELIVDGDPEAVAETLRATLGPNYLVEPPPARNAMMDDAMARVKALMGISVVALIVAVFIIYNSVSISVVERVKEIGTLRSFGATKAQIFGAILTEWAAIGAVGSAIGLAGGFALADGLIRFTVREINNMIPLVVVDEIAIPRRVWFGAFALGGLTTLAAAYFPARSAMGVSPVELLRQGMYRIRLGSTYLTQFKAGVVLIVVASIGWSGMFRFQWAGLISAVLGFLGNTFLMPQITIWLAKASRPLLRDAPVEAFMAADNNAKYPQRTALTVIALAGSLAMMISATSIMQSFKLRGEEWLRNTLPFDLSINSADMSKSAFSDRTFSEDLMGEIAKIDGVDLVYGVHAGFLDYKGSTVMLVAPDLTGFNEAHSRKGGEPFIPADALSELIAGRAVAVSENFAAIQRVEGGDDIELPTPSGPRTFKVLAAIEDYSWPKGAIFMNRDAFKEHWNETGLTYLDVNYREGADHAELRGTIARALKGNHNLFLYAVDDIVKIGDQLMDQSLKFTNIQVSVAVVIGFLGIVNTLLISVMQRKREIGLLRAVGMSRTQVVRMIVVESVFLAALGGVLGVGFGLIGAKWPLAFHVFQLTGFRIPFVIPWGAAAVAMCAAVAIGFLAAYVPARFAARLNVLDAIGYE